MTGDGLRGRFLPAPPRRRVASAYDFWWAADGALQMRLPLRGGRSFVHEMDYEVPAEDMAWLSGPPEAPTLACPIHAVGAVARGLAGSTRIEWAGMLTGGRFLPLAYRPRERR